VLAHPAPRIPGRGTASTGRGSFRKPARPGATVTRWRMTLRTGRSSSSEGPIRRIDPSSSARHGCGTGLTGRNNFRKTRHQLGNTRPWHTIRDAFKWSCLAAISTARRPATPGSGTGLTGPNNRPKTARRPVPARQWFTIPHTIKSFFLEDTTTKTISMTRGCGMEQIGHRKFLLPDHPAYRLCNGVRRRTRSCPYLWRKQQHYPERHLGVGRVQLDATIPTDHAIGSRSFGNVLRL